MKKALCGMWMMALIVLAAGCSSDSSGPTNLQWNSNQGYIGLGIESGERRVQLDNPLYFFKVESGPAQLREGALVWDGTEENFSAVLLLRTASGWTGRFRLNYNQGLNAVQLESIPDQSDSANNGGNPGTDSRILMHGYRLTLNGRNASGSQSTVPWIHAQNLSIVNYQANGFFLDIIEGMTTDFVKSKIMQLIGVDNFDMGKAFQEIMQGLDELKQAIAAVSKQIEELNAAFYQFMQTEFQSDYNDEYKCLVAYFNAIDADMNVLNAAMEGISDLEALAGDETALKSLKQNIYDKSMGTIDGGIDIFHMALYQSVNQMTLYDPDNPDIFKDPTMENLFLSASSLLGTYLASQGQAGNDIVAQMDSFNSAVMMQYIEIGQYLQYSYQLEILLLYLRYNAKYETDFYGSILFPEPGWSQSMTFDESLTLFNKLYQERAEHFEQYLLTLIVSDPVDDRSAEIEARTYSWGGKTVPGGDWRDHAVLYQWSGLLKDSEEAYEGVYDGLNLTAKIESESSLDLNRCRDAATDQPVAYVKGDKVMCEYLNPAYYKYGSGWSSDQGYCWPEDTARKEFKIELAQTDLDMLILLDGQDHLFDDRITNAWWDGGTDEGYSAVIQLSSSDQWRGMFQINHIYTCMPDQGIVGQLLQVGCPKDDDECLNNGGKDKDYSTIRIHGYTVELNGCGTRGDGRACLSIYPKH